MMEKPFRGYPRRHPPAGRVQVHKCSFDRAPPTSSQRASLLYKREERRTCYSTKPSNLFCGCLSENMLDWELLHFYSYLNLSIKGRRSARPSTFLQRYLHPRLLPLWCSVRLYTSQLSGYDTRVPEMLSNIPRIHYFFLVNSPPENIKKRRTEEKTII